MSLSRTSKKTIYGTVTNNKERKCNVDFGKSRTDPITSIKEKYMVERK